MASASLLQDSHRGFFRYMISRPEKVVKLRPGANPFVISSDSQLLLKMTHTARGLAAAAPHVLCTHFYKSGSEHLLPSATIHFSHPYGHRFRGSTRASDAMVAPTIPDLPSGTHVPQRSEGMLSLPLSLLPFSLLPGPFSHQCCDKIGNHLREVEKETPSQAGKCCGWMWLRRRARGLQLQLQMLGDVGEARGRTS